MSPRHTHTSRTPQSISTITRTSRFARIFAPVVLILTLGACDSASSDRAEPSAPRARELVDLRSRILDYTAGFEPGAAYTPPGDDERARLAEGVGRLLDGDAAAAQRLLAPLGLAVTRLTDTDSGRRYDEIAAARSAGDAASWGRLYVTADSALRWNVQVPHPVSDRATEELGVRLLEEEPSGALVLAGAHRRAGRAGEADVAHSEDSAFHTVVDELQKRGVPGLQLHGFAQTSDRPYEAIVSGGAAQKASGEASALADRLEADGLRVCRGWSARCPLEGTRNVQGRSAERRHAPFLHVELSPDARDDGPDADETARALADLLSTWSRD
ncbi:hypothetical protein ACH4C6_05470 [Streptomyces sp. NPDC017943]|uniref:hypothetical protein n=1 Tax=Streptomyces sp. NPDC017943 TaxID=3365019 RepID=UPI00379634DC